MRSSSLRTHGGHVAVQPIHDAHQLEHVIHIVVRAGLLGLERVAVTREYGLHAGASPPDDVALGPVADHEGLRRFDPEPPQHLAERGRRGLALAGVVERDRSEEHTSELQSLAYL